MPRHASTHAAGVVITRDCERPEIAFRLLDFMTKGESYIRQRWGEEGVDWREENDPTTGKPMVNSLVDVFGTATDKTWAVKRYRSVMEELG